MGTIYDRLCPYLRRGDKVMILIPSDYHWRLLQVVLGLSSFPGGWSTAYLHGYLYTFLIINSYYLRFFWIFMTPRYEVVVGPWSIKEENIKTFVCEYEYPRQKQSQNGYFSIKVTVKGQKVIGLDIVWESLRNWLCLSNIKATPLMVHELWQRLKFLCMEVKGQGH